MTSDEYAGKDKKPEVSENVAHRGSVMSYEKGPLSPVSSSGDSTSEVSHHERYNRDHPEPALSAQSTHTSFAGAVGGIVQSPLTRTRTGKSERSVATTATSTDPAFEVDFREGDPSDPQNWPIWKKSLVMLIMSYATTCVVLYSTSYTSAIPGMQAEWGIDENTGVLGMTTYLIGIACGALVLAPLSEMYGRRPVYMISLALFTLFVLPCALAQNITTILVMRFFGAFCASALISNCPGSVNDIVDEEHRALAYSVWSIGPMNGRLPWQAQAD